MLLIQSMLRVTYTAPRTMHWITRILKILVETGHRDRSHHHLLAALQDYSRGKVREAFFDSDEPDGLQRQPYSVYLPRLPAHHVDPRTEFRFVYRNSMEHFYPQHPTSSNQEASFR